MGYARSVVMMITGSRGSGKSLFLSSMVVEELLRGKTVWSNMPVKLTHTIANKYNVPKLKTKPLDLDAFYALSEELQNGVVCIDEAQNMSDSRSSLTLKNRLLNAIVAQVRKRNLNVYYTTQDPSWVDVRLRFATDVEVACFDLGYSPWGRNHNVEWGKLIRCYFKDLSGYMTGTPYFITGKYYRKSIFKGYKYWNCYDTSKVTDLEEAFTSVKLDMKQRIISNKDKYDESDPETLNRYINEKNNNYDVVEMKVKDVLKRVMSSGITTIDNSVIYTALGGNKKVIGAYMKKLGAVHNPFKKEYDLSEVNI
jgi:hypothetical protein